MLDQDVKIARQIEDARFDQDGTTHYIIRVDFTVGKHGPFTERFDRATFTAQIRDDKLNAFAREVRTP
jgi:hypothetical protein